MRGVAGYLITALPNFTVSKQVNDLYSADILKRRKEKEF